MVDILHRVGIKASSEEVFKALATRDGLAAWWTTNTRGDSKVGGTITFGFSVDDREIGGCDVKVLELEPAKRVLWQIVAGPAEWIGTKVGFELKQEGDYAIVPFKHADWKEPVEFMNDCSTKWAVFLMSLKALVETGKGTPNPADPGSATGIEPRRLTGGDPPVRAARAPRAGGRGRGCRRWPSSRRRRRPSRTGGCCRRSRTSGPSGRAEAPSASPWSSAPCR